MTSRKMQQGAAMQGDEAKLGGTGPVGLRQPSAICWMALLYELRQHRHYISRDAIFAKIAVETIVPGSSLARVLFKPTVRELIRKIEQFQPRTVFSAPISVSRRENAGKHVLRLNVLK